MTEQEFIARFDAERVMLQAWGDCVSTAICEKLQSELGDACHGFLKIAPKPRLKDLNSALHKAFVVKRGKYTDPYNQMEDKVGVRFVVLLGAHVDLVGRIVEAIPLWNPPSKDLDFESKRTKSPYHFDKYQSLHYVVRARRGVDYEGTHIVEGTPCEIQIRTLLQHAHSELTHDSFYKPSSDDWKREARTVERLVARGMALIETTDALFEDVMAEIKRESKQTERWIDDLATLYRDHVGRNFDREALSNHLIVDAYLKSRSDLTIDEVKSFYEANVAHVDRIRERAATTTLYRLPAILLAYYLAKRYPNFSKTNWPLTERSLEDIFTDVGRSLD